MSLMEERDLYDSTIILLPRHVTLENYVHVANLNDLPRSMLNTLWVSLLISFSQIVSCTLVAYGFARYEFKFKKFWFGCVLAVIIIPPQTIQSALYTNFANFDILRIFTLFGVNAEGLSFGQRLQSVIDGTGTGLIALLTGKTINLRASVLAYVLMALTCMGLKNGLYIYMMRQYFKGIPTSLEEAAYVEAEGTLYQGLSEECHAEGLSAVCTGCSGSATASENPKAVAACRSCLSSVASEQVMPWTAWSSSNVARCNPCSVPTATGNVSAARRNEIFLFGFVVFFAAGRIPCAPEGAFGPYAEQLADHKGRIKVDVHRAFLSLRMSAKGSLVNPKPPISIRVTGDSFGSRSGRRLPPSSRPSKRAIIRLWFVISTSFPWRAKPR